MRKRIVCIRCDRTLLAPLQSTRHFHRCPNALGLHADLRLKREHDRARGRFEIALEDAVGLRE